MDLIMKQMPVVVSALNVGFLTNFKIIYCDAGRCPYSRTGHLPLVPCLISNLLAGLRD